MSDKKEKVEEKKEVTTKPVEKKESKETKEVKPVPKQIQKTDAIKAEITGFATLTYKGRQYKRGDKLFFESKDYKKFEKWLKKV